MHCVSTYPMKPEDANLKTIVGLRKFNCEVGYSGHENGLAVSYAAASLGITSLERHITLDRTRMVLTKPHLLKFWVWRNDKRY